MKVHTMKITHRHCAILLIAFGALLLGGCNTTKGVGADIEKAGEGLKNSADRNGAD
jgi:predicted small secreted protein